MPIQNQVIFSLYCWFIFGLFLFYCNKTPQLLTHKEFRSELKRVDLDNTFPFQNYFYAFANRFVACQVYGFNFMFICGVLIHSLCTPFPSILYPMLIYVWLMLKTTNFNIFFLSFFVLFSVFLFATAHFLAIDGLDEGAANATVPEDSLFVQLHEAFGKEILKDLNERKMLKTLAEEPLIAL